MSDNREAIERAKRAACSIRSATAEEMEHERMLREMLDCLSPERGQRLLEATKTLAAAATKARSAGVPSAVLEYEGLRALILETHSQLMTGDGLHDDAHMALIDAAARRMEEIRPEYELHVIYSRRTQREREDAARLLAARDRDWA